MKMKTVMNETIPKNSWSRLYTWNDLTDIEFMFLFEISFKQSMLEKYIELLLLNELAMIYKATDTDIGLQELKSKAWILVKQEDIEKFEEDNQVKSNWIEFWSRKNVLTNGGLGMSCAIDLP